MLRISRIFFLSLTSRGEPPGFSSHLMNAASRTSCISELVPFDKATVLFVEDAAGLMIARESPRNVAKRIGLTLSAAESNAFSAHLVRKTIHSVVRRY
jgi:hypothetical protein